MSTTAILRSCSGIEDATARVDPPTVTVAALRPTGPEVLAVAAYLLPVVSSRLPFSGDVHAALVEALDRLGVGADRHHRLRLADDARDMFATYLTGLGLAKPENRASETVRGWVVFHDLAGVQRALAGAAWFWCADLAAARSAPEGGWVCC